MTETQAPAKKPPLDQTTRHAYNAVPPRSSATTVTAEPPASRHYTGHQAGLHPEDMPYLTASKTTGRMPPRSHPPIEEEYDEALYPQRPPSSARRYKPFAGQVEPYVARKGPGQRGGFYTLIVGSSILAGIAIALCVPPLWQRGSDQLHYGFPRTYQVDANVGHGTAQYPDDHFIALNNHGYVEVLEIPEGVPDKNHPPQIYLVARPDSASADQAPATLEFKDVNGDGKMDLIVHCNGNATILYNDGHTFRQTP